MRSDGTVYAPDVLAHRRPGYGDFEWLDHLRWICTPMPVIFGRVDRTCTLVIEKAAFIRQGVLPDRPATPDRAGCGWRRRG